MNSGGSELGVEHCRELRSYLQENLPQVKLIEPEGTYLVWLDFKELGLDAKE